MIKLIIFDLDGVLIDAKEIHFTALNKALGQYAISWDEHLSIYDGLKTNQKLNLLTTNKGLPISDHNLIWNLKQKYSLERFSTLTPNEELIVFLNKLVEDGYKLAVCTNSIRKTAFTILHKLNIIEYFDLILSNEDVINSKPNPEIYWKAMILTNNIPSTTLIIEDSPTGLKAANDSNANVFRVANSTELLYDNLINHITNINNMQIPKWVDTQLNIIIPMAGAGTRFSQAGYSFPKPLIDVNNKPMIQLVIESLNIDAHYIYIVQAEHKSKYNLDSMLKLLTPNCTIIETNGITEGAACSLLLASDYINNNNKLLIANSDQFINWNSNEFMYKMSETNCDGGIVIFNSTHPKWSYVKLSDAGNIIEVAEKNPISTNATVGVYFWKYGSDFVKYANQMIEKNIRINNEFYTCPVYNEALLDNKIILPYTAAEMWGLGTPEDLTQYLNHIK